MVKKISNSKMIKIVAILCVFAYIACFVVPRPVRADEETHQTSLEQKKDKSESKQEESQKSEVVYAKLDGQGKVKDIYVVNSFSGELSGELDDYGDYSAVESLSLNGGVEQGQGGLVKVKPFGHNFYYKGKLKSSELPWLIEVSHKLNGQKIDPSEMGGKSGDWLYTVDIKSNPAFDKESEANIWARNLMLQITCSLSDSVVSNLKSEAGIVAESGSNKLVTFICLPGKEAKSFTIEGQVQNFHMPAIQIAASTFSLDNFQFELPDLTSNKELLALKDATKLLSDGSASLLSGLTRLDQGAGQLQVGLNQVEGAGQELLTGGWSLAEGVNQYLSGVNLLATNGSELVAGAAKLNQAAGSIQQGLAALAAEGPKLLAGSSEIQGGLAAMAAGLSPENLEALGQVRGQLQGLSGQLGTFKNQLGELYGGLIQLNGGLEGIINGLTAYQTSMTSEAIKNTLQLNETALTNNLEASAILRYIDEAGSQLTELIGALGQIRSQLEPMLNPANREAMTAALEQLGQLSRLGTLLDKITELASGIDQLNTNYATFHAGLARYVAGIDDLNKGFCSSSSAESFYPGLTQYLYGVSQYISGAKELNANSPQLLAGFQEYLAGTNQYVSGIHSWAEGYSSFSAGISQVTSGARELASGNQQLHSETSEMDGKIAAMIKEELADYKGDESLPSFASSKNHDPDHIQFVLMGEPIASPELEKGSAAQTPQAEPKGIWDRFLDLFN